MASSSTIGEIISRDDAVTKDSRDKYRLDWRRRSKKELLKEEFECPDCGKIFNSENGLNIHKGSCYTEGDEKPVKTERFTRFDQNRSSSGGSL